MTGKPTEDPIPNPNPDSNPDSNPDPNYHQAHAHPRRFSPTQAHHLDAPERRLWLPVEPVLEQMALAPGMTVADIGAGTGYFTLPIAHAVGPVGHVTAVDVSPEMLALLNQKILAANLPNIDCISAESASTGLAPESFDRVLLANVWHEIDDRAATLAEAARLLRPGGRIAILDWSPDLPDPLPNVRPDPVPGPPLAHRIPLLDAQHELVEHGWHLTFADPIGRYSWLLLAARPGTRS